MGFMTNTFSAAFERFGLGHILGFQMGGMRDMYGVFGWKRRLVFRDFLQKYQRHPVARRVVNSFPDALWADPPILAGDPVFQQSWQDLLSYQPVFATLQKLDKLCRMGRYAILVVGFDDGLAMDQPVATPPAGVERKVLYLQPYSEGSVRTLTYEENTQSARFGLPVTYEVMPGFFTSVDGYASTTSGAPITQRSFKVHWTRVLHVAENALESPVFGSSCLEPIFNSLDDLEKISGGSAEIFWLNARSGLHIDVDKEMDLKADDADALESEIDEYSNNLRRVIRTRGVKVTNLGASLMDPKNTYDTAISDIAVATGLPKRELMGSEAGQLASQQDRANWANRCDERVSEYCNPIVLIPFLRMMIDARVLSPPTTLTVTWPEAFKMNPLERAQTSAQMARSAANLSRALMTVQQINHANAVDSRPTYVTTGSAIVGSSMFANAASDAPASDSSESGDSSQQQQVQMEEVPPLFDTPPKNLTLLSEDECRQIIGFGKHMPVFDSRQEATIAIGSPKSSPSFINPNPG